MAENDEFLTFPEIENHQNKAGKAILQNHANSETWVATEKIHGCNFSFIYGNRTNAVTYGRRNGLLQLTDTFHQFQSSIVVKHSPKIPQIFELVKEHVPTVTRIRVFGEFYGGDYPAKKNPYGGKPIQRSIFYTNDLEFEAFDLFYDTAEEKDKILNYKEACRIFQQTGLPYAEIVKEGTLQELLDSLDPDTYETQIYKKHGLEKLEGNFAEGFVLKPVDALFWTHADGEVSRISLKYKSKKFAETLLVDKVVRDTVKEPPKSKKPEIAISEEDEREAIEKVLQFVTSARLASVLSKLTEDEGKSEKKVIGLMIADVWKDFSKTETDETVRNAEKLKVKIMPLMRTEILRLFALHNAE